MQKENRPQIYRIAVISADIKSVPWITLNLICLNVVVERIIYHPLIDFCVLFPVVYIYTFC